MSTDFYAVRLVNYQAFRNKFLVKLAPSNVYRVQESMLAEVLG
jgi:hypothetical protein